MENHVMSYQVQTNWWILCMLSTAAAIKARREAECKADVPRSSV